MRSAASPLAAALALALAASPAALAQGLFKCVQPNGRVVYQGEKCDAGARQSLVRPPDPPSGRAPEPEGEAKGDAKADAKAEAKGDAKAEAKAAPAKAAAVPPISPQTLVGMISNYQSCAEEVPAFAAKYGEAYAQWRSRNFASILRYEQDGNAQRRTRESIEYSRREFQNASPEVRAARAETCDQRIGPLFTAPK